METGLFLSAPLACASTNKCCGQVVVNLSLNHSAPKRIKAGTAAWRLPPISLACCLLNGLLVAKPSHLLFSVPPFPFVGGANLVVVDQLTSGLIGDRISGIDSRLKALPTLLCHPSGKLS